MSSKFVFAGALVAALSIPVGLGIAQNAPPVHKPPWPIYNWLNHQPTEDQLRALHEQDVTRAQAREIDRLYDELMSSSKQIPGQHPAPP